LPPTTPPAPQRFANPSDQLVTVGSQIVDQSGRTFRVAGVNWFGFETRTFAPHGLSQRSCRSHLEQIRGLGFNTIRLPFCVQMFDAASRPSGISSSANPDLRGLSPADLLDRVIELAGCVGLRIILDCHRSDAGGGPNANGLWYTPASSEERWL